MNAKATMRTAGDVAAPASTAAGSGDIRTVKDASGRTITVRRHSVLEEMRLLKVLGEHNSSYYSLCSQIARVSSIANETVMMPNSEREIEMLATRLGHEGIAALMEAVRTPQETDEEKEKVTVGK